MPRTKEPFFKAFKKFITRGNVLDMAVGVVVGGSFSKIVNGLVNYVSNPLVGQLIGEGTLDDVKTILTPEVLDEAGEVVQKEVAILWGTWIQTMIDFLIVALCIFTMVRVIVRLRENLEHKKIAEEEAKTKEAEAKAKAEKEAAKIKAEELAASQLMLEESQLAQAKLLAEIRDIMKGNVAPAEEAAANETAEAPAEETTEA